MPNLRGKRPIGHDGGSCLYAAHVISRSRLDLATSWDAQQGASDEA